MGSGEGVKRKRLVKDTSRVLILSPPPPKKGGNYQFDQYNDIIRFAFRKYAIKKNTGSREKNWRGARLNTGRPVK